MDFIHIKKMVGKSVAFMLCVAMLFSIVPLDTFIASNIEGGVVSIKDFVDGTYVPGELVVMMIEGIRLSKEELTNPDALSSLFPGVNIVGAIDIQDVSGILPEGYEYIPYEGQQILRLVLAYDSKEYMLEAIHALERNPLVASVELNGIEHEDVSDPYGLFEEGNYVPGELIISMINGVRLSREELSSDESLIALFPGVSIVRAIDLKDVSDILPEGFEYVPYKGKQVLELVLPDDGIEYMVEAIKALKKNPLVNYVELNGVEKSDVIPNDPYYISAPQWGMNKIQAPLAWDYCTGSSNIAIGVIDSGIDYYHPDLAINTSTSLGYNFVSNVNDARDDHITSHGSHVAGIIGAVGNNVIGVTGLNWAVTLVPLKVSDSSGSGNTSAFITALARAQQLGIRIVNYSRGEYKYYYSVEDAIRNYDGLLVTSAGNNGTNNDVIPHYPSSYNCDNIIAVAGTDSSDSLFSVFGGSSNYGATSVHLAAPGISIWSTVRSDITPIPYESKAGTSIAAPHVTGAAALLLSYNPHLSTQQIKAAILNNVDRVPALSGQVITGGRLNVYRALRSILNSSVSTYSHHSLLLKNDGKVWACGYNEYGMLGDGTTIDRLSPIQVPNLSGIVAVSAGYASSMALKNDGKVWIWGWNGYGALGNGTTIDSLSPIQVPNLSGIVAVSMGEGFSMALKSDGTVWVWGANHCGQLGDGTKIDRLSPIQVPNLSGIVAVSTGAKHSMALKSDGTVWVWGANTEGELGDGTRIGRLSPIQVPNLSGIVAISAGTYHSMALKSDGTVWVWGCNMTGQLGDGTAYLWCLSPIQVPNLSGIVAISAGGLHSMALKSDNSVWVWGCNGYGALGDGTTINRLSPIQVPNLSGILAVSAGGLQSMALKIGETLWAWGWNEYGLLGDGTTIDRLSPVFVMVA